MFLPALIGVFVCVCVCLSVTTITKTIVDGFVPNFTGRFLGEREDQVRVSLRSVEKSVAHTPYRRKFVSIRHGCPRLRRRAGG